MKNIKIKKIILTSFAVAFATPSFAFNFYDGKFLIDTELKKEISEQIINSFQENNLAIKTVKQKQEPEILAQIREEMEHTKTIIERYTSFRKNVMTRAFIDGQKEQKIAYEQMLYWDVPAQIYDYINKNFDIKKMQKININCRYTNSTAIEVSFNYEGKKVNVIYAYDANWQYYLPVPISHTESSK
ncbi:MAG: hypothetical protein K6E94_02590 [Elusimicrobiaceae bacterium]|nr:hypothetical protein [Elusimicrobiaceae bacterium]